MIPVTDATATSELKHLSLTVNSDGIAIVKIDVQGAKVNTLSTSLAGEFDTILNAVVSGRFVRDLMLARRCRV